MKNNDKTKEQLLKELAGMRQRLIELEEERRIRKEEEAHGRKQIISTMLNATRDSIFLLDSDGTILFLNKNFADRFGKSVDELINKNVYSLLPPDLAKSRKLIADKVFASGKPVTMEDNHKGDYLDSSLYPVFDEQGKVVEVVLFIRDITDRKQIEEELKEKILLNKILMDSIPCVALLLRPSTREIIASNKMAEQVGAVPGKQCFATWGRSDKPCPWCRAPKLWASGKAQHGVFEGLGIIWDAHWIPVSEDLYIHFAFDITERKKVEKLTLDSEEKYRTIVSNVPGAIYTSMRDWTITFMGEFFKEISGYPASDFINNKVRTFASIMHPDDVKHVEKIVLNALKEKRKNFIVEYRIFHKNGDIKWISDRVRIIFEGKGEIKSFEGVLFDITELKQLEEEKLKSHKLESVGILAGGIAHDFNNLLAGILNNVYMTKMNIDRESQEYTNMESAEKAISRASNLTRQLLTFSRGGAPVKKTAYIIEVIKESAEFALRGSNVKCEYNVTDDLWPVEVDEGQMNQVMHNLILNADQSMPEGGTIQISIENSELGSDTGLLLEDGRYVKIVIQDRGVGIEKEHLKKIFDPYFTTKEMGRGLGLSITYSIIKQHNGLLTVEAEKGTGTTFTIYLPASDKQVEEKKSVENAPVAGEGKILLMDDDEAIRDSLGLILKSAGYKVEYAKDGDEAIKLYKKAMEISQPFNAVILDLTVPGGMGGKESIKKLSEIDPNVKAIVSSGYSNDPVMANFREYGFSDVYNKGLNNPYELSKILHKVLKG
ncbi:MAG: PAS domain S-box protein [Thermodesulfovibrionia bacterium]